MSGERIWRETKSLCTPSKLPASDYVINPYLGCPHRCLYCYASFMGRFTGHQEPWGTYLEPRRYSSLRLPKNLRGKTILIGSVTDAYNPAEAECRLMPPILEALKGCQGRVEILTKSALVLRDLEQFREIPNIAVGVSLSNLNQFDNAVLEPGASSAAERLNTLRVLHENGIQTWLFIAPYLPGLTDLQALAGAVEGSADYLCVENLNLRGAERQKVLKAIGCLHPELIPLYEKIYAGGGGHEYWRNVEKEIQELKSVFRIPIISYLYHTEIRKGGKSP